MKYKRTFYSGNNYLGEAHIPADPVHNEDHTPLSYLWFCGQCGEVFARAPVNAPAGAQTEWQAFKACCKRCPSRFFREVPGSMLFGMTASDFDSLPLPVLQLEALAHARAIHLKE